MIESISDELLKPDMRAVLSRTHLGYDLHSFLLPVLEAISNGMHGIEARFKNSAAENGKIEVHFIHPADPLKFRVTIADNGIGLTDENYKSFRTPFSGYKLKENGRGFGRFIAFKVYSSILYQSRYNFFSIERSRSFKFDIANDNEIMFIGGEPKFRDSGLQVEYRQPLTNWHDLIRGLRPDHVADEIGSHFLPYFLYKWLPKITIQFDELAPQDITEHFKSVFVESDSGQIECEIDGENEKLEYSVTRIPKTRTFNSHCLLLSAADRIVGKPRDLTNKLGQPFFVDEKGEKYIVIAVVRGPAFETRLNDARTGINLPPKSIENIVSAISDVIEKTEVSQIEKIKDEQSSDLGDALRENPILRLGLRGRTVSEYVAAKPNNWSAEEFVSDLAIERFRASGDLSKAISLAAGDPENYSEKLSEIVSKIDAAKKEALAEYVIHRKNIIELLEAARKFKSDGKREPEDVIHELVFRRFSDSVNTEYFSHNLWLIDDALAFLPYVSSDRTLQGGRRKLGDKVADLIFFDDSIILGDNDGTTINIIEFKKPSRDDYKFGNEKLDPVLQVINTLEQATDRGGINKTDGSHIAFTGVIRRFSFIIADHTPSMVNLLRKHDFKNDWNPKIFFRFRDHEEIFIQAIGYETLVENAKKRNQAFFSVLLGE
ncbi:ATP-binding protein [Mesorhizobium sp. M0854]|uniref:ATP-binding protein n=1 Tax=Mesorhizobium sp. M0854 TaxID=2957013 RepID=UPI003337F27C